MPTLTKSRKADTKPADSEAEVRIKPLNIQRVVIPISGTQPLITNKFSDEAERKLRLSQSAEKVGRVKAPRDDEGEYLAARYLIEDNGDPALDICGFPASGIKKAMVAAGGRVGDTQMTWLRAVLNVEGEDQTGLVRIIAGTPTMRTDHVVQAGRGNLRYRPQFWPWEIHVPISFNEDQIKLADVVNLLQQAGFSIGIGDWRPEKNGPFGTFEVTPGRILSPR